MYVCLTGAEVWNAVCREFGVDVHVYSRFIAGCM